MSVHSNAPTLSPTITEVDKYLVHVSDFLASRCSFFCEWGSLRTHRIGPTGTPKKGDAPRLEPVLERGRGTGDDVFLLNLLGACAAWNEPVSPSGPRPLSWTAWRSLKVRCASEASKGLHTQRPFNMVWSLLSYLYSRFEGVNPLFPTGDAQCWA